MFGILALQFVFMLLVIRLESIFTHSSTLISVWEDSLHLIHGKV